VNNFKPIWTTDDFRATVTALRALAAVDFAAIAPVIDIHTRQRIA
jgi:hypothetical protein